MKTPAKIAITLVTLFLWWVVVQLVMDKAYLVAVIVFVVSLAVIGKFTQDYRPR